MHDHDHSAHSHAGHAHVHRAHGHDSHEHGHAHAPRGERRLLWALALTTSMLVVEAVGGWISGSLALLADAAHMLVDASALLFAWLGALFARRPADARRSFGYARLEVLVGYTNALTQVFLVGWIMFEAVARFLAPAPILSGTMLAVAIAGLVVNLIVLRVLGGHDHDDVNTAGARLHVLGDLLGSVGAVAAALLIRFFGWLWADPLISVIVALLILNSAIRLLRRCAHILLEGVPEGAEVERVAATVVAQAVGVREVHHVHVWQLSGGQRIATLHARLEESVAPDSAIVAIQQVLRARFGIAHATVQVEGLACRQVECGGAGRP
ncbi:MAG: cation transporter [Xanthomonadales bacterium]|nr:cation transporter [Xanthomonadales bacterium]